MRLHEFDVSLSEGTCGTELFAWARYKRGDVPTHGEFSYIDGRVKAKFPNAELVSMKREFVPASAEPTEVWWALAEPTEVRWTFKWIVFDYRYAEPGTDKDENTDEEGGAK